MRLDILKDNLTDCAVAFTRDGEDETANIANPNGNGNIIVTYFHEYTDPFGVHYQARQRRFTDAESMFYYVVGLVTENVAVVELLSDGKCDATADLASNALLDMTVEELAGCFGYSPDALVGKVCRIRSWAKSYDADIRIVSQ
jgi:hypothetical protein